VRRLRFELPAASPRALVRFGARAPIASSSLVRLCRSFRPDVVHAIGAGPNAAYLAALRGRLGAALVLTAQGEFGGDPQRAFERSRSLRGGLSRLLRRGSAVTACSSFVLEELAHVFDIAAPAVVIPNGVSPEEFDIVRPAENGYVFAAGRLVEQKALDTLLRGFARADLGGRRLVVAGDGPERPALERLAGELGVDVSFTGSVGRARLVELMRGADLFAFPSRYEAFGIALLEAMAAGTPAVAARVGGIPEFASDGENALLVPPGDEGALAAALTRLASDVALRERLAAGGRARAEELSWARVAPRYVSLYRRVAHAT
jgi:glycogen(starch) synthase